MSQQIVGPIEKKSLGTSSHPNQRSKTRSSGLWKESFLISLVVKQKVCFPLKPAPTVCPDSSEIPLASLSAYFLSLKPNLWDIVLLCDQQQPSIFGSVRNTLHSSQRPVSVMPHKGVNHKEVNTWKTPYFLMLYPWRGWRGIAMTFFYFLLTYSRLVLRPTPLVVCWALNEGCNPPFCAHWTSSNRTKMDL